MSLDEIGKIINRYEDKQRMNLINYYAKIVDEKLENGTPIDIQKIALILDVSNYIPEENQNILIKKAINLKIQQTRGYILENFKHDFQSEKTYFTSISKWMEIVIKEIKITFNDPIVPEKIKREFHLKLCDEFFAIFCSYEKFNSAGNQLLIDLLAYFETFKEVSDKKELLIDKIRKNFSVSKCLSKEKINELYATIVRSK